MQTLFHLLLKKKHLKLLFSFLKDSGYQTLNEIRLLLRKGYVLVLIRRGDIDLNGDVRQSSKILPSPLTIPH